MDVGVPERVAASGIDHEVGHSAVRYQGINAVFEKDGYRFELQFHTPRTFELKTSLHAQYEGYRVSTDPAERLRLWDEMAAEQAKVDAPSGSMSIGEAVRHSYSPTP